MLSFFLGTLTLGHRSRVRTGPGFGSGAYLLASVSRSRPRHELPRSAENFCKFYFIAFSQVESLVYAWLTRTLPHTLSLYLVVCVCGLATRAKQIASFVVLLYQYLTFGLFFVGEPMKLPSNNSNKGCQTTTTKRTRTTAAATTITSRGKKRRRQQHLTAPGNGDNCRAPAA